MIQRIQSVFLAAIAFIMTFFLIVPIWHKKDPQTGIELIINATGLKKLKGEEVLEEKSALYIFVLAILAIALSIISLFSYRHRTRQIFLNLINSLLMASTTVAIALLINDAEKMLLPNQKGQFQIGLFLPVAALICNMLANRFIRKDENLVRSADRIR